MKTRIAELRNEKGLTLKQMGEALHIKDNALSQYETGKRNPQIGLLLEIADYFGVSLEYLTCSSNKRDYPLNTNDDRIKLLKMISNNEIIYDNISKTTALSLAVWILTNSKLIESNYPDLLGDAVSFVGTVTGETKVLKNYSSRRIQENDALQEIEDTIIFGSKDNPDDEYYGPSPTTILEFMHESERIGHEQTKEVLNRMKKIHSLPEDD